MEIVRDIKTMREKVAEMKRQGKSVGLVPTMGYLHEGHLALIDTARKENDVVVVSDFVNPLQFGPNEDYLVYPRDMDRDAQLCSEHGVDFMFVPTVEEMYPKKGNQVDVFVDVKHLDENLCGRFRPGHFRGVVTVVTKLFNIVSANRAYVGMKEIQELRIIEEMVNDLDMNIEIVPVPTVREPSGLALSSRNTYLSAEEREKAASIYKSLLMAKDLILEKGVISTAEVIGTCTRFLSQQGFKVQYFQLVDYDTLELLPKIEPPQKIIIATAVFLGKVRLIDNLVIEVR